MNPADFQALIERINNLLRETDEKLKQADAAFRRGMQLLDAAAEFLGPAVTGLKNTLVNAKARLDISMNQLTSNINATVAGAGPVTTMMTNDDAWLAIRNLANTVAAKVERPKDRLDKDFKGLPADTYHGIVEPQLTAARRMGVLAEKASTTLQDMALQGVAFYIAVAAALVTALGGIAAAIIGFGSVAGAPIGVAGVAVAAAAAVAFAGASFNFAIQQDRLGGNLEQEAPNPAGFSAGPSWPKAKAL